MLFFVTELCALYDYVGQLDGDLSFVAGERIIVLEALDNGWWRGCCNTNEGWFPATYVQVSMHAIMSCLPY